MFGWQEWVIIILVVLLLFGGAKKLPELANSLGKSLQEFKKGIKNVQETKDEITEEIMDNKSK